ncbi:MAG: hypothetical protein L3J10_09130 [Sulfurimonas sp.]|nr:hypothetical protein [Sulfurimonas sp.]
MNLEKLKDKSILLFGKSRAFSSDEFQSQIKFHKISIETKFDENVKVVIDGRMMTPYEQNKSYELYKNNKELEFVSIDIFEKELAKYIDENTLLMSLKLSHNKQRLKSFIQNTMLSDEFFLKLIKMYSWIKEDFFENDDNRDVSAAFISRFYENIERNHNVQYATTGFVHLVSQTNDQQLLKAIYMLEPLKYHLKIKMAIALKCETNMQELLFKEKEPKILEALSLNKNLNANFVTEFLKDETLGINVARNIELSENIFKLCKNYKFALALNETLTFKMQEELFNLNDDEVCYALSSNHCIDEKILKKLFQSTNEKIKSSIYENKATPVEILELAYKNNQNYAEIAKNENTPIEILYQLQLDSKYERSVKTNATFGRHIQQENIGWQV